MPVSPHYAGLDEIVDWDGLGRVPVRAVIEHYRGGAYKAAFIRRAIAEGKARSIFDLSRWEGEMKRRGRDASRTANRNPYSDFQVAPKNRSKPWPL
jgi:hypothetical protein